VKGALELLKNGPHDARARAELANFLARQKLGAAGSASLF